MNIEDKERSFVYSTFQSIKNELKEYGKLTDIERLGSEVVLESQIQYLKNKVKVRQLRHAYM